MQQESIQQTLDRILADLKSGDSVRTLAALRELEMVKYSSEAIVLQLQKLALHGDGAVQGKKIWCEGKSLSSDNRKKLSLAKAKWWKLRSPEGEIIDVHNLRLFCIDHSLSPSAMSRTLHNKQKHHKGWTKVEE